MLKRALLAILLVMAAPLLSSAAQRAPSTSNFPQIQDYQQQIRDQMRRAADRERARREQSTPSAPLPAERIADFSADLTVERDGDMTVKETIDAISAGRSIRHGIFRDFPTHYTDKAGNDVYVAFSVFDVTRDGHPEPYSIEGIDNGKRVRIGDADIDLPAGRHSYTITYRTDRMVGFFPQYDELYWNVTGNGWAFTIQHAEAIVHMPEGVRFTGHSEYSGLVGSRGGHASAEGRAAGYRFLTTAPLAVHEGLTFALDFAKGTVMPPTPVQRSIYFLRDNAVSASAIGGLMVLAVYFFTAWWRFGRDPKHGVVIPLFSPPRSLSAASIRFIRRMDYDRKCFAAALISLAVKGYLRIKEEAGTYVLYRGSTSTAELTGVEAALARPLFSSGNEVALENSNHELISKSIEAFKTALTREDEGVFFNTNRNLFLGGLGIAAASVASAAYFAATSGGSMFIVIWMFGWLGLLVFAMLLAGGSWKQIAWILGPRLAILVFAMIWLWIAIDDATKTSIFDDLAFAGNVKPAIGLAAIAAQAIMALVFYRLLKAPTLAGARVRDEIDGFKMFLETTEKDRLEKLHPPSITPDVFEKYLPYAIALDAENAWSRKFAREAERAGIDPDQTYHPYWYTGANLARFTTSGFVSGLGSSIASAGLSASMAPGSVSGGGGGGFSGGGGGGGGGGGW